MPLVMPRLLMPLSLRYTSVVSLFGLLSVLNTCRHYLVLLKILYNQVFFIFYLNCKRIYGKVVVEMV